MYSLNAREPFVFTTVFSGEFYQRTGGDFPTLLTDIHIEPDGITTDSAAWKDRLPRVRRASGWVDDSCCAILQSQSDARRSAEQWGGQI